MTQPDPIVKLAGVALGRAAWIVSELPEGDLLTPFAFAVDGNGRQLVNFDAPSQEEAIQGGRDWLAEHAHEYDGWAFARDQRAMYGEQWIHLLVVETVPTESDKVHVFAQRYRPRSAGGFRFLGRPEVIIDGEIGAGAEAEDHLAALIAGARSHPRVVEAWEGWCAS